MEKLDAFEERRTVYKTMYLHLFNAVTDALEALDAGQTGEAAFLLIRAQQECEELYING